MIAARVSADSALRCCTRVSLFHISCLPRELDEVTAEADVARKRPRAIRRLRSRALKGVSEFRNVFWTYYQLQPIVSCGASVSRPDDDVQGHAAVWLRIRRHRSLDDPWDPANADLAGPLALADMIPAQAHHHVLPHWSTVVQYSRSRHVRVAIEC
jgi:hypothetical protein